MKPLCAILGFLGASAALVVGASSAQAATSLSSIPNACWTTDQPFTLVENEYAKLTWDVYGNLTLTNHSGNGSSISWGLNSTEPLTGTNAGKLCFGNGATRLRIHTSTGEGVWNSGVDRLGNSIYSTPNGTLTIEECTIQMKSTSGAVVWSESLPQCELRSRPKPASTKCWPKSETQVILSDEDVGRELVWEGGNLWLRGKDGVNSSFMSSAMAANSKEICHQSNGDLVIFNTSDNVLKHLGYGENVSLDECGVEFWSVTMGPYSASRYYSMPHKLIRQRTQASSTCTRRSAVSAGVCWDKSAAGTLIQSGFTRLDWTTDGRVKMLDSANNELWTTGGVNQSLFFCLHQDGNMELYKTTSNGWASTWYSDIPFNTNPNDGYTLELKSNVLRVEDAHFDAQCSEWEVLGIRPITDYDVYCGEGQIISGQFLGSYRYPWRVEGSAAAEPLPGGGYSYVKDWHGGNSNFGAGAWLVAGALNGAGLNTFLSRVASTEANDEIVDALPTASLPTNYAEAIADAGANATLFGQPYTLVEGIASAEINNGPHDMIKVMVGGGTVFTSSAFGGFEKNVPQKFFDKTAQFVVGGIPITATFEATGTVGMRGTIDYNQDSDDLTCTITPFASVDAFGSIGIGVSGFSLGVEGELNLVSVGFPLTNQINTDSFAYTAKSDFTISSLEGSLSLYADATLVKYTKEVASFDGYSASSTLFKVNGSLAP